MRIFQNNFFGKNSDITPKRNLTLKPIFRVTGCALTEKAFHVFRSFQCSFFYNISGHLPLQGLTLLDWKH